MDFMLLPFSIPYPEYYRYMDFSRGGIPYTSNCERMLDSRDRNAKQVTSCGKNCVQVLNHKPQTIQALSGTHNPCTTSQPTSLALPITKVEVQPVSKVHLGYNIHQLSKLKRFLTTLQQFGNDISRDVGERVHSLILLLVNSAISIEEFHQKIQDITNCPLRPFVVPFLKSHLPMLQNEIIHFARLAKQTPQQYLRQYEQAVLDSVAHPSGEPFEIFQSNSKETRKRRTPSTNDYKRPQENGYSDTRSKGPSPPKRHHHLPNPPFVSGLSPKITANHEKCNMSFSFDDSVHDVRAKERDLYEKTFQKELSEEKETEDEWRNIYT
ncbi:protein CBFA2T3-like, partial [Limulus polyphemus]|uniref:Protein CBFA2T3-like n=1 Tax=Limulus polyphemus TaxID=6850 RepID=A0ABM1SX65_LIMPO